MYILITNGIVIIFSRLILNAKCKSKCKAADNPLRSPQP